MRSYTFAVLLCIVLVSFAVLASAQAKSSDMPRVIRYGGTLTQVDGTPRTGTFGITFSIYADDRSTAPLWQETLNVATDEAGHYSVLLGAARSEGLPAELFATNQARWLATRVENEQEQPRVLLVAVPYALKAADAETLGGKPLSAFVLNEGNNESVTSSLSTGKSGGSSQGSSRLSPLSINTSGSTGTQNQVSKWIDDAGTIGNSTIFDNGFIGMGTTSPSAGLDVSVATGHLVPTVWVNQTPANAACNGCFNYALRVNAMDGAGSNKTNIGLRVDVGNAATNYAALFVGGNVGIGTLGPVSPLDIETATPHQLPTVTISQHPMNPLCSGCVNQALQVNSLDGTGSFKTNIGLRVDVGNAAANYAALFNGGNVGIGTTSPTQRLDVNGNINATGNATLTGSMSAASFSGSGALLTSLPAASLAGTVPNSALGGTYSNAVTLSNIGNSFAGNGLGLTNVNAASVNGISSSVLNLRLITYLGGCDSCSVLTTSDNQKLIYQNLLGSTLTLVSITCYSDAGTPSIDIQRDNGALSNVTASTIGCSTAGSTVSSFSQSTLANNDKLNFLMTAPDGTVHRVTVIIKVSL